MSLNWDYKISDKTKVSTVVYGSWGRGGGSNGAGAIRGNRFFGDNLRRADGSINVDLIQAWNSGQTVQIPGTVGTSTRLPIAGNFQNACVVCCVVCCVCVCNVCVVRACVCDDEVA